MSDLLDRVREAAGLDSREAALRALRSVVCALRERLAAEEVEELRGVLSSVPEAFLCENPGHTHRLAERSRDRLTEPELAARMQAELELPDLAAARRVSRVVLAVLAQDVTEGAAEAPPNSALAVGALARPRRGTAEDEDEGS